MPLSEQSFQIMPLPTIVFGVGAVAQAGMQVQTLGRQNALIVTDKGVVGAGLVDKVREALTGAGVESLVFDGVEANPTDNNVDQGAEMLREVKDAVVMAVGGGSSMDAAKAIALQGPNGGTIHDFPYGCQPETPANPVISIPTTAGTGSETNMFGLITDSNVHRKMYVAHPSACAKITILDPALTVGLPKKVTATCGMDVLTHAIEAYTAQNTQPYAEGIALRTIEMVAQWLPTAYADGANMEARSQMILASHMAGIAFSTCGLGVCHAMGHPLSARLGAAHGQTLATMLPHAMTFNMDACEEKYARVAFAMGVGDRAKSQGENAAEAVEAVKRIRAQVETDLSVSDLGGNAELIPTLVDDAMNDMIIMTTPKFPMPENIQEMYQAAL